MFRYFSPWFCLVFFRFQPSITYAHCSSLEALSGSEAPSCQCCWFSSANGANTHIGFRFQSTCSTQTSLCSTCYCWFVLSCFLSLHPHFSSAIKLRLSFLYAFFYLVQSRDEFEMENPSLDLLIGSTLPPLLCDWSRMHLKTLTKCWNLPGDWTTLKSFYLPNGQCSFVPTAIHCSAVRLLMCAFIDSRARWNLACSHWHWRFF